jgi:hypothetical protein
MKRLYWRFCKWIGYTTTLRDYYDPKTLTLKKKNSHLSLLKHMGETDDKGWIKVKEIFQIQIRKI